MSETIAKRKSTGEEIGLKISDQKKIQGIARRRVFESFEGLRSLDTLKTSRRSMEKGLSRAKHTFSSLRKRMRAGVRVAKARIPLVKVDRSTKNHALHPSLQTFFLRLGDWSEIMQQNAKTRFRGLEGKAEKMLLVSIQKGLQLLLKDDTTSWIIHQTRNQLGFENIATPEDLISLDEEAREKLTDVLYPYRNPSFKKLAGNINLSINLFLGAIVATNLPGTGIAVSFISMAKTLIRISNCLNFMAAVYGRQICSPHVLFRVSAIVLKSIDDWESNPEHLPLSPEVLNELFQSGATQDEAAFQDLLSAVVKKEAYIAIPGVGMISLGKINLDDFMLASMDRHLVQDYFEEKTLKDRYGSDIVSAKIQLYVMIYQEFRKADFFRRMRKIIGSRLGSERQQIWQAPFGLMTGSDPLHRKALEWLDEQVNLIYERVVLLDSNQRDTAIIKMVSASFRTPAGDIPSPAST